MKDEYAWLIESKFSGQEARWWNGIPLGQGTSFTTAPNEAVRFCRREDAERVASHMHMTRATEHCWMVPIAERGVDAMMIDRFVIQSAANNLQHAHDCPVTPDYPEDCLCPIRFLRAALEPPK